MARVRDSSRGIVVAAVIVLANFAIVLQITGISYGRFQWVEFASAYDTPTATATVASTPTATPTLLPEGGGCITAGQCESTFCVDGFCCNRECNQPGETCNLTGREGVCQDPAAAPALGSGGLVAGLALLMAIGALALRATRRRDRTAR